MFRILYLLCVLIVTTTEAVSQQSKPYQVGVIDIEKTPLEPLILSGGVANASEGFYHSYSEGGNNSARGLIHFFNGTTLDTVYQNNTDASISFATANGFVFLEDGGLKQYFFATNEVADISVSGSDYYPAYYSPEQNIMFSIHGFTEEVLVTDLTTNTSFEILENGPSYSGERGFFAGKLIYTRFNSGIFSVDLSTQVVEQLHPALDANHFVVNESGIYFIAGDNVFHSDGTTAGTTAITNTDPDPALQCVAPGGLALTENGLIFAAENTIYGREIWVSDGTPGNTQLLLDYNPGVVDGVVDAHHDATHNGVLYLQLAGAGNTARLAQSDGTIEGTIIVPGVPDSIAENLRSYSLDFIELEDSSLFVRGELLSGQEAIIGFAEGESSQAPSLIRVNPFYSYGYYHLTTADALLTIEGNGDNRSIDIYRVVTGTVETVPVGCTAVFLGVRNNQIYFKGCEVDEPFGSELYAIDLTNDSLWLVADLHPGEDDTYDLEMFEFAGESYLRASDTISGLSYFSFADDQDTIVKQLDIFDYNSGIDADQGVNGVGNVVFFKPSTFGVWAYQFNNDTAYNLEVLAADIGGQIRLGNYTAFTELNNNTALIISDGTPTNSYSPTIREGGESISNIIAYQGELYYKHSRVFGTTLFANTLRKLNPQTREITEVYIEYSEFEGSQGAIRVFNDSLVFVWSRYAQSDVVLTSDGTSAGINTSLSETGPLNAPYAYDIKDWGKEGLFIKSESTFGGDIVYRHYKYELLEESARFIEAAEIDDDPEVSGSSSGGSLIGNILYDYILDSVAHLNEIAPTLGDIEAVYEHNELMYWRTATEVWVSDGTFAGTQPAFSIVPGDLYTLVSDWFVVMTIGFPNQVTLYNLGSDEVVEVDDIVLADQVTTGPFGEIEDNVLNVDDNRLYLMARHPNFGQEIHYLDFSDIIAVSGKVYVDENGNNTPDAGDIRLSDQKVLATSSVSNSTRLAYTDENGEYTHYLFASTPYTISAALTDCYELVTTPMSYDITPSEQDTSLDFGLALLGGDGAVGVYLNSATPRCGFTVPFWLTVRNDGCEAIDGIVSLALTEEMSFAGADITPSSIEDSLVLWAVDTLWPGELRVITVNLVMPDEAFTGEDMVITTSAETMPVAGGEVLTDQFIYTETLRCAIDPNDKQVWPRRMDPLNSNYTRFDERLRYLIRFQNTGNDTAFTVRIEDQLSSSLDPASLQLLSTSHDCEVTVSENGLVNFIFRNILLVDSLTNEPLSHGFVLFDIAPETNLTDFTEIHNTAGIYFDFNQPIITNTVTSTMVAFLDEDNDGFNFWEECDDENDQINPDADEIPNNGVDENCDGEDVIINTREWLTADQVSIYPNPVLDRINFKTEELTIVEASLIDVLGRVVFTQSDPRGLLEIATNGLPAATYQLKLSDEKGGSITLKVVKLK